MSNITLSAGCSKLGRSSILLPLLYPGLLTSRAASLNSAIGRGLRKSQGVGFRGKERYPEKSEGPRDGDAGPTVRRGGARTSDEVSPRLRYGKREIKDDREPPPRRSRAARFNDPDSSFGKRSAVGRTRKGLDDDGSRPETGMRDGFSKGRQDREAWRGGRNEFSKARPDRDEFSKARSDREEFWKGGRDRDEFSKGGRDRPKFSQDREDNGRYGDRDSVVRKSDPYEKPGSPFKKPAFNRSDAKSNPDFDNSDALRNTDGTKLSASRIAYLAREATNNQQSDEGSRGEQRLSRFGNKFAPKEAALDGDNSVTKPKFSQTMDNRIPLSIPYTTPASEFLYGSSVVQAAINSSRHPRRKLYKLYIYTGENRENVERDASVERLAKKNAIPVQHVSGEWLRLMDKMSSGRPHNGYILEASPLPKLPVSSLGEIISQGKETGFEVMLDYQSREEAAVNGTDNFIPLLLDPHGRKPFVLLLDSILDPGNLGGILRTASFLGITAVAISTRNSASFTPVVLKASAGASENVTLFSVNKPAGFIADSKLAGWKVYAAVAPNPHKTSSLPVSMTTDELVNPLDRDPCILMLGNEGEGLRWNLRSKADVELSVQGSGMSGGVDSLNVSVATGILCASFMRRTEHVGVKETKVIDVDEFVKPKKDLF
jgi:21S rRNA (GM2251-2'-O)-methyltransferase